MFYGLWHDIDEEIEIILENRNLRIRDNAQNCVVCDLHCLYFCNMDFDLTEWFK